MRRLTLSALSALALTLALPMAPAAAHPSAAPAEPNPNCSLSVPADPTSARGLATPYELRATDRHGGECHEASPDQSAFVEAAILDPATGAVSVYHPLVVDAGATPAAPPVLPVLPDGAVVGIWFGYNGDTLTLTGPGARRAVNGLGRHDTFGQYAYINAPAFFAAANKAVAAGLLVVPDLGVDKRGMACPSTRDFFVVDQDQSDNVAAAYWLTGEGQMSQVPVDGATKMTNGSDEGLLASFIDPALGCSPWRWPSLDGTGDWPSLAANELQAAYKQAAPVALVPMSDPMVLRNGRESVAKTNLYRAGVNMGRIDRRVESDRKYCANLMTAFPARAEAEADLLQAPGPGGTVLADFLADRYEGTLQILGCNTPPRHDHHGDHRHDRDDGRHGHHAWHRHR